MKIIKPGSSSHFTKTITCIGGITNQSQIGCGAVLEINETDVWGREEDVGEWNTYHDTVFYVTCPECGADSKVGGISDYQKQSLPKSKALWLQWRSKEVSDYYEK